MTDGLRGLGIDGRGILSLFPDIFPIAIRFGLGLLTVHAMRKVGPRDHGIGGKRYASVELLRKPYTSGRLPVHGFALNNTKEHPTRLAHPGTRL